jgi:restriction system protein
MAVLVVALVPLFFGYCLILLIARYSPNVPRLEGNRATDGTDERPEITPDEFADVVHDLLRALGLETVFSSIGTGGVVDVTARDPKPLSGGRLLVHASPVLSQGQIDAAQVLGFAESVRGDMGALKGIFIALAGFTAEARSAVRATPAPIDLIDGPALLDLVREHVPGRTGGSENDDMAEALLAYRGFSTGVKRHPRHEAVDETEENM